MCLDSAIRRQRRVQGQSVRARPPIRPCQVTHPHQHARTHILYRHTSGGFCTPIYSAYTQTETQKLSVIHQHTAALPGPIRRLRAFTHKSERNSVDGVLASLILIKVLHTHKKKRIKTTMTDTHALPSHGRFTDTDLPLLSRTDFFTSDYTPCLKAKLL